MSDFLKDLSDLASKEEEPKKASSQAEAPDSASEKGSESEEKKEEAPAPSQVEQKATETKPEELASDKEVPFHKHPRWIRTQNELKELRELAKQKAEVQPVKEKPSEKASEVPAQYQKLFGDDVAAFEQWKQFQREETRREAEAIYQERKRQEQEESTKAESAQKQAAQWAEDQFLELAEETGIAFHDRSSTERNQILDICVKYNLFDTNGMPNVKAANELRPALFPPKTDVVDEKKRVAAKTNAKSNSAADESKVFTPSKLKKMNMSQFFN